MTRSVVAPASSANLGAGFDVFGLAVSMYAEVGVGATPDDAATVDEHHPARVPFERLGGTGPLWFRTNIPMARGLGFSGAARVAAAGMGAVVAADGEADALAARRGQILQITADLEGHGDNVAASIAGGVVAYVDGRILPFRVGPTLGGARVVAWVPDVTTSTDASRKVLDTSVERTDAVANIARSVQFALAFAHDEPELLIGSTEDRLHQSVRVTAVPGAAEAMVAARDAGAWCSWLSGSGPTVAALCDSAGADAVAAAMPPSGHTKVLTIDGAGLRAT